MTVNLTNNAIPMICEGGFEGNEFKPIVQIADLKLLSSQQSTSDRYRLLLSDGTHTQQGMLATQMNNLVSSGKLQKGSVVQLLEFVSQTIQNRKIIIIISLNVILEKCDPIGQPKQFVQGAAGSAPQAQPQMEQPGMAAGNHQQSYSADASVPSGPSPNRNVNGRAQLNQTNSDNISYPQSSVGSIPNNSNTGGYVSTGPRFQGAAPLSGNYGDQNRNQNNVKTSGSQVPFNSHPVRPVQPVYKPPPVYMNRGPIAKNEAPAREIPIRALNPYQGRWTIKARVTSKSELRTYTNARGAGKVFSFDLLDAEGGEIQVTCFNAVADQFYSQIEAGKVYMLSNGMLKPASKSFNHLNNEYEIYLENSSRVQLCVEDDNNIKRQQFRFRPISEIESMQNNSFVDVIGVVSSINLTTPIMKKDGTETLKKTLQLKDMSGRSVELTLWGSFCNAEGQQLQNMVDSGVYPVVAVKAGRISEFNGKSVGTLPSSQLFIEPDFLEAHELKAWFEAEGNNTPSVSISRESSGMGRTVRKLISQIKDERLGTSEKPDWITVSARISFVKTENFVYTACPLMIGDRQCNKKVINNGDGQWRCDRCDKSVPQCDFRYILQLQLQDFTGIAYVTAFQESGEEIMGISAKDLYHLKEEDDEKFMDIIRSIVFNPYIFKLKVKEEIYNDEQRVKCTVVKAEKLNFSSESKILLDLMNKFGLEDTTGAGTSNKVEHQNAGLRQSTPAAMNSTGSRNNFGKDMGVPANQTAQYGNTYSSTNNPSMASTGVYLSCNSCGGTGHNSRNCPGTVKREAQSNGGGGQGGYANRPQSLGAAGGGGYGGGGTGGGVSGECYKCHKSGHWARDCPGTNSTSSVYGGGNGQTGRYGGISNERVGGF